MTADTPRDPLTLLDAVNNPQIPDHAILKNTTLGEVRATLDATRPSGNPTKAEIDRMARALKAEWERIEKAPVTSYVATFADLARVALATRPSGDEALRHAEAVIRTLERQLADTQHNLEVALVTPSSAPDWQVHNHGPHEMQGIACREYSLNGRRIGYCKIEALR